MRESSAVLLFSARVFHSGGTTPPACSVQALGFFFTRLAGLAASYSVQPLLEQPCKGCPLLTRRLHRNAGLKTDATGESPGPRHWERLGALPYNR